MTTNEHKVINYFTYGSNLDIERAKLRGVNILEVEAATLHNWQLSFSVINDAVEGAGFANIKPRDGARVEGAVIYTDRKSIMALDDYEDYPIDYLKQDITVESRDGSSITCFAYVGNPERVKPNLHPTKSYLKHILAGKPFFSEAYFNKLQNTKTV